MRCITTGCSDSPFFRRRCKAHGCWRLCMPARLRDCESLPPCGSLFFWASRLVLANMLLVHSMALSSIYRLGAVLAVEAALCGAFLLRMLLSWRTGAGPVGVEPAAVGLG